jgi:O-antigen/teichoic acid export membrane protein
MENKKLSSGIINILLANICNLTFSILTSFLLPKFLSVETYASIKTFQMYVGYVGLLHLGYVDGMYIKNGGKDFSDLNKNELSNSLATLRLMQIVMTILLVIVAVVCHDITFAAFTFAIFPLNMAAYFQMLLQSIGEFKKYSTLIRWTTFATFVVNMVLLLLLRTDKVELYLGAYVVLDYIIWIALEITIRKLCNTHFKVLAFDKNEVIYNVKNGILLTLGNLSSSLFTGMDRWFVKVLLETIDFAQYSFAVSIEHFVNVALNPVSITLYNYFCKNDEAKQIRKVRNCVLIFATCVIAAAFPAKFVLEHFLANYIEASKIIFLLFSAQIFYFTIKSIYVNLYKARRKQKIYFIKLLISIMVGFIFNAVCFLVAQCREAFAVGTVLSSIFWWLLCLPDFKEIKYKINELMYMFTELLIYNICGLCFNSIVGFCIYVIFTILMMFLLLKDDTISLIKTGQGLIKRKIKH